MSEANTSGWKPYDIGVLVKILPPEEKKTSGGIILGAEIDAVSIEAVQNGVLVDAGELATADGDAPQVGEQVLFAKYSGQFLYSHMTDDEGTYRLMDCTDIRAKRSKAND
jgi:co-chaperonin GroES (HSP10)